MKDKTQALTPLRILHIEDSPQDADIIRQRLVDAGSSFQLDRASSGKEFAAFLQRGGYDIILADYELPGVDAPAALQLTKSMFPDLPFICVSRTIGEENAVALLKLGATDYVSKGRLDVLPMAIQRGLDEAANSKARRQAEAALQKERATAQEYLDIASVMMIALDAKGEIIFCNKKGCEILGYEEREIIGRNWFSTCLPSNVVDDVQGVFAQLMAGHRDLVEFYENPVMTAGGECRVIAFHSTILLDESSKITGILSSGQDITERKWAESYREMGRDVLQILNEPGALQDSMQRVLAALKTGTQCDAVGIRLQDGADFPYFVQQGFSNDFLLTENSLIERGTNGGVCRDKDGNVSLECTCGLVISGEIDPVNPLFTSGGSCWTNDSFPLLDLPLGEDPRHHPRNHCIHQGYASVALTPIRDKDRIVGLIQLNDRRKGFFSIDTVEHMEGIASHIGAALMRKRAEEEQAKLEAQLRQAQKMEAVGQLAGGIAHDFNNLLQAILGYGDMALMEAGADSAVGAYVEQMIKAGNRAGTLVSQLLAFSRRQVLEMKDVNLNDSIADLMKMLHRVIGEHITLEVIIGHDIGIVRADPGQLGQILMNLCVNARDAMGESGKIIIETENAWIDEAFCESRSWAEPGRYVLLSVTDTGCGMDKETLEKVFDPFFTTKEVGKGTGLGLATVYGLVKQHQGLIHVYSEVGKGTTFKIYLPLAERSAAVTAIDHKVEGFAPGGTETLLLAEDDWMVRNLSTAILQRAGYTVLSAADGEEALRVFEGNAGAIDLALLDVMMPKLGGKAVYERIREMRPDLRFLFASGYSMNALHANFVLDEGLQLIQKPYARGDLLRKVREVLDAASTAPNGRRDTA